MLKKFYFLLPALLFCLAALSQPATLRSIDNELARSYKALLHARYDGNPDSLSPLFKNQVLKQLENPLTFNNSLDSLAKLLTIKTSADQKIKFYSWDECSGGTWHMLFCVAQFKGKNGKIIVQPVTSENVMEFGGYDDSSVYEINQLSIRDTTFYLTFAWGTHGAGHQHMIARVFKIENNKLVSCTSCFATHEELVLEYPRSQGANLHFNAKTNEISYNEFTEEDEESVYADTDKVAVLRLVNGVFVKQ